jgi:phosphatidate cytidylyltransferase
MSLKQPSNLVQRVLVALVGIPLLLWLTWQGGAAFVLLVCVLAIAATSEFHHLA